MKKSYRLPPAASTAPDRADIADALFEKLARLNGAQHAAPNQLGAALRRAYGAIHRSRPAAIDWADVCDHVLGERGLSLDPSGFLTHHV